MWRVVRRTWVGCSLVLLLATVGAWVRAQWVTDEWRLARMVVPTNGDRPRARELSVQWERGSLVIWAIVVEYRLESEEEAKEFRETTVWEGTRSQWTSTRVDGIARPTERRWLGFSWEKWSGPSGMPNFGTMEGRLYRADSGGWSVAVPWWFLTGVFAVGLGVGAWRWVRRRQGPSVGVCAGCGYDLRATPEGGGAVLAVCPECGRGAEG